MSALIVQTGHKADKQDIGVFAIIGAEKGPKGSSVPSKGKKVITLKGGPRAS